MGIRRALAPFVDGQCCHHACPAPITLKNVREHRKEEEALTEYKHTYRVAKPGVG